MCNTIFILAWVGWQAYILLSTFVTYVLNISHHAWKWSIPRPMQYGSRLRGYTPYAQGLWSVPTEWIIQWMARKRKLANLFILFKVINKFSYRILPIIYAYNAWRSQLWWNIPTPVKHPDSGWTSQLRSYIVTPVAYHDSGRTFRLRSHIMIPVIYTNSDRMSWLRSSIPTLVVCHDSNHTSQL
jgi:hypothetical protein